MDRSAPKRQRKHRRKNKRSSEPHPFLCGVQKNEGAPGGQAAPLNGTEHPPPATCEGVPASGSASACSSAPSALPSLAATSRGRHHNTQEALNHQSTPAATCPSGSVATPTPVATPTSVATPTAAPTKFLAMDCEMVGAGPKGHISQLARCSIVSYDGDVVYDKFIHPAMPVTDYRTRWSGIRHRDLVKATPYAQARKEILRLLTGKVVIGHAVHNDFKVLGYSHPAALTRDTSRIPPLNERAGFAAHECASLKRLTKAIFNRDIQTGRAGHSSVEDAKATMELYKVVQEEWERRLHVKPQAR